MEKKIALSSSQARRSVRNVITQARWIFIVVKATTGIDNDKCSALCNVVNSFCKKWANRDSVLFTVHCFHLDIRCCYTSWSFQFWKNILYVPMNTILCKIIKDINIWIWYNRGQKNKYKSQCIEISIKDYVFKLRAIKV